MSAKLTAGAPHFELHVVSSAATLLEGDALQVELDVRPGASLTVRSVAAQLAHPCVRGGATALRVRASVAAGGRLAWLPEPTIVAGGDKVPRKGGPGVTRSDLLVINKTDLAPLVGANLDVMSSDAAKVRGALPTVLLSLVEDPSAGPVAAFVEERI